MPVWLDPAPISPPPLLTKTIGGHPLVAQVLAQRGIVDVERARAFLDPARYTPASPFDLPDMDWAIQRVEQAIDRGQRIAVWGDFDVDGQTATTLLVQTLRSLGADVTFHIPVRAEEGHGVNLPWLQRLIDDGAQLVVTCDTGSDAHEAVDYARQRGVDLVITDHHDLPPALPSACAVVNPKLLPAGHPLGTLPGVGVAYKLAEALLPDASAHLDLVALGIVADVAVQTGDARYLLQRGLASLRETGRLGLQTMLQLAQVNPAWLNEEHIGFELAPRLNALGRLGDANLAVEFLTTADPQRARVLATTLEGLNAERKRLTDQIFQGALAQIERDPALLEHAALVLAHPSWPAGVIGIVASRLAERFHRPVVLLAAPPGQLARGSARSVEGCNISAAIAAQSALLAGFGGHPMAAGLTIDPERIPELRRKLSRSVAAELGENAAEPGLAIDGRLPLADLSLDLVADLERLAPFGPGNPRLVLVSPNHALLSHTTIGRHAEHRSLTIEDAAGSSQQVIWWQGAGWPLPEGRFDLAYTARASTWRGQRNVQVEWVDARPIAGAPVVIRLARPTIVDHRRAPQPVALLEQLRGKPGVQVWCEGEARRRLGGQDRSELAPADPFVIWTIPPGRAELQAALDRIKPKEVVLFAEDPGMDQLGAFLQRLAGLAKRALRTEDGLVSVQRLAAATAQRAAVVRLGLRWLAGRGHVRVQADEGDAVWLAAGDGSSSADLAAITAQLRELLAETAAFRRYFAQADAEVLLE
ncbi:MAG TPA: single-stranded-DNA-specific exonuclease RecJ [Anaerolineae bacterium]|nr:single-stranded-DNA-specific exonuclease RecJ [Anaerolineae bacterium]